MVAGAKQATSAAEHQLVELVVPDVQRLNLKYMSYL
jgi:hypothetical protein